MNRLLFLRKFIANPCKIGSITPSSRFLKDKMLSGVMWDELDSVVELGAGTGVFTEYVMAHKSPACRFLAIEQDKLMRAQLKSRYPRLALGEQAENLCRIMHEMSLPYADCIISGLPFAVLDHDMRRQILDNVVTALKPGGVFITFQYSLHMKAALEKYFPEVTISFELLNLPPAFIYSCRK